MRSLFLVPKLRLGNALAQKLCFVIRIKDNLIHNSLLFLREENQTFSGQAGAWRRVCSQARAWEQGKSTSLGECVTNFEIFPIYRLRIAVTGK